MSLKQDLKEQNAELQRILRREILVSVGGKPRITWRQGFWRLLPVGAYMYEDWTLISDDLTELVDLCHGRRQLEIVR